MDTNKYYEVKSSGEIVSKTGLNIRAPYSHQKDAMANMDCINAEDSYSTLIVLPTGGGKTYTASTWLLRNAIDKNKKILWIAHRQMLLDQAAESFQSYAYAEVIPHISSFRFRIISGSQNHDKSVNIKPADNLLIMSKDSLGRNLKAIDKWLKNEDEVYLVVDEAHHSTAKTYRRIIEYVQSKVKNLKLIGLTATPFRTSDSEQGLLAKIYHDGVKNGMVYRNDIGITYQIDLKELIKRQILSTPNFIRCDSEEQYGDSIGINALESIQRLDTLPDEVARKMAESAPRNRLIVKTYKENADKFGQTIVFAVNVVHAIQLSSLFKKEGLKADFIVSDIKDSVTGVNITREDNERKIEDYRTGKLQVLINVNILTEGVDLPQTKTVFLARPTVSKVLMTQMVGRALRGEKAGGTAEAYIVSFIDHWNDKIAWVNPESIFEGNNEFSDNEYDRISRDVRLISLAKIEEFARILDENIDTTDIERIPFEQKIPIGYYAFNYTGENMDNSYQIMVYNSTQDAYKKLMDSLPELFKSFKCDDEYPSDEVLSEMERHCRDTYFCGEMIPPYEKKDVISILKYYAQKECAPGFYTYEDAARSRLDISKIAKKIVDEDMGPRKKTEYLNSIWDSADENLLKLFFVRKICFLKLIDIEILKLSEPSEFEKPNVVFDYKKFEDMPLRQIGKINPDYERELRDSVFEKSKNEKGQYQCAICKMSSKSRIPFQVDHIKPMNKGGKTVPDNLQILCRRCNGVKSDK